MSVERPKKSKERGTSTCSKNCSPTTLLTTQPNLARVPTRRVFGTSTPICVWHSPTFMRRSTGSLLMEIVVKWMGNYDKKPAGIGQFQFKLKAGVSFIQKPRVKPTLLSFGQTNP